MDLVPGCYGCIRNIIKIKAQISGTGVPGKKVGLWTFCAGAFCDDLL